MCPPVMWETGSYQTPSNAPNLPFELESTACTFGLTGKTQAAVGSWAAWQSLSKAQISPEGPPVVSCGDVGDWEGSYQTPSKVTKLLCGLESTVL